MLLAALSRLVPRRRRTALVYFPHYGVTLSSMRVQLTGEAEGAARHPGTGRFTSRRAAETFTAADLAWFAARPVTSC